MHCTCPPLKRRGAALDSAHVPRTHELRLRIERSEYQVDPMLVAEAMLRQALSHRRWWKPLGVRAIPAADIVTTAGALVTDPIHVNGAAASAARRSPGDTHTHSS